MKSRERHIHLLVLYTYLIFYFNLRSRERFIAFECFDTVIEHAERVVQIASQINAIKNSDSVAIHDRFGLMGVRDC